MPRDAQKGTQSTSKDKDNKPKEESNEENAPKISKPADRLMLIDSDSNRKKGRRKAPTALLVFELDEKILDFLDGKDSEIIYKSLFEIVKDGKRAVAISNSEDLLERVQKENFELERILVKEDSAKKLKDEAMNALIELTNEKIMPESSIFIGYLFTQSEMTDDVLFKFATVVTPDHYFANVGTIPRDPNEPRGVLSKIPKTEETSTPQIPNGKEKKEEPVPAKASSTIEETAEPELANGESTKRRRGRSKKSTIFGDEFIDEEDLKLSGYDRIKKTTPSTSSKLESPDKKASKPRGRKKAVEKGEVKAAKKNKLNLELTNLSIEEEMQGAGSMTFNLKLTTKKLSNSLHKELFNFNPKPAPIVKQESSTSSVNSKRRISFEEEIFDDEEIIKTCLDSRIFNLNPINFSSKEMNTKIKNIRMEPNDIGDGRPISKKLKQTEKKVLHQPNAPAADEEHLMVDSDKILLEYKSSIPGERPKSFQIYARDIEMLDPDQYINDTLLQFYLKIIHNEFLNEDSKKRVYFFNTYIIDKLKSEYSSYGADTSGNSFEKAYNSVKKWTKDVDIFDKDYLVFPNYDGNAKHWSLFIICHPNHFIPVVGNDHIYPQLLYFDSLGTMDFGIGLLISSYLKYEFKNKKADVFAARESEFRELDFSRVNQMIVPLQDNFSDCGLYALEFAERFLTCPHEFLNRIEQSRDFLDLFPLTPLKSKRTDIKKIIFGLSKGKKEVLKEYLAERKQRFENAANKKETEYIHLPESELIEFCKTYGEDFKSLDPRAKDVIKLKYYLFKQEKKLNENLA